MTDMTIVRKRVTDLDGSELIQFPRDTFTFDGTLTGGRAWQRIADSSDFRQQWRLIFELDNENRGATEPEAEAIPLLGFRMLRVSHDQPSHLHEGGYQVVLLHALDLVNAQAHMAASALAPDPVRAIEASALARIRICLPPSPAGVEAHVACEDCREVLADITHGGDLETLVRQVQQHAHSTAKAADHGGV